MEGAGRLQEKAASKLSVNGVLAPKALIFASNCPKIKASKIKKRIVADMLRQGKSDKNVVFDVKTVQRFRIFAAPFNNIFGNRFTNLRRFMRESNLIELFKTLNIKELKEFFLFLDSPYFDRGKYRKEVKIMFEILAKHASNGWETADLGKEKIYKKVFPGAAFVEGRLEKVMVEFSKSLRNFLLAQRYLSEENWQNTQADFIEILQERGLDERAEQVVRPLLHDLMQEKIKNADLYFKIYKIYSLYYTIKAQRNTWREDLHIGQTLRYLGLYYFDNRLRLLNHYLVLNNIGKVNAGINIEKEIEILNLYNINNEESPSTHVLKKIFELFCIKDRSIEALENLLGLLNKYEYSLSDLDKKTFFSFVRNYCMYLIKTNYSEKVAPIYYHILKDNLSKGYFYHNNQISPGVFFNMCLHACRAGDFIWVYEFIDSHRNRIMGDDEQFSYYNLALSNYFFYQKKFEDSLDYLPRSLMNIDYHMTARCIEVMNYYELGSDLLNYRLDAFKMYLSRGNNKLIASELYENTNNFVNLLYQIIQSRPKDPKRKDILLERIQEKPQLAFRDWLIAKVKELK